MFQRVRGPVRLDHASSIAGGIFGRIVGSGLASLARVGFVATYFFGLAAAQADEHPFKGRVAHAARLVSPSAVCLDSVGKALLDLRRNLTVQDIAPDRFIQSPYLSIKASRPERSGKLGTYHFHLAIDPYDNACRLFDADGGSPSVPGCECVLDDPVAAAQPFGAHRSILVLSGRTKALVEVCAVSRSRIDGQFAEYRRALAKYARFKIALPERIQREGKKPDIQVQRDAADFSRALKDIEDNSFDEKAYADQRAKLTGLSGGQLDEACAGAGNMLIDRMLPLVTEMKAAGYP